MEARTSSTIFPEISAEFPTRIPLLWLQAPFASGIIAGRLFPAEIHPGVCVVVIIFAFAAAATAKRRVALLAPMLLPATALAGYVYIAQKDEGFTSSFEYPEREATLTLEISRLYESTHLKARGIARVSVAESHLNHVQDRETYFSVEPVKREIFEDTLKIGRYLEPEEFSLPWTHRKAIKAFLPMYEIRDSRPYSAAQPLFQSNRLAVNGIGG
ncbi:MAG: hypothetical protein VYC82_00705 [Verrucomicrobiota bacterium]|nr:hypothetical protein [Verrucomicrobiota bacterium]